jgi:hypothetical protein
MDKPSPNNPHVHDWLGTQSFEPKSFENPFDPKQILDGMSAGMGPMKALTVQQMELLTLISRRAQAYLGIPQRLSRCRTHSDLVNEQMRFWQTATSQYQDSTSRIAHAWSELFQNLPQAGRGAGGTTNSVSFPKKPETGRDRTADLIRMPGANTRVS